MNIIMLLPVRVPSFFVHLDANKHFHRSDTIECNAIIYTFINEIAPKTVSSINRRLRCYNIPQSIIITLRYTTFPSHYLVCVGSTTIDDFCFMTKRTVIIRYFCENFNIPQL